MQGVLLIIASYSAIIVPSFAYNITINRNKVNSKVCKGDELIFTCTGQSTLNRWTVRKAGILLAQIFFSEALNQPGSSETVQNFHFTLISTANDHFVSTLSTVATNALNNAVVECADTLSKDSTTIRIQGLYRNYDRNNLMLCNSCEFDHT